MQGFLRFLACGAALAFCASAAAQDVITLPVPKNPPPPAPRASAGSNLGSAQLTAVVRADGVLVTAQSKGTVACSQLGGTCQAGSGLYVVHFARDVSGCAATATVGAPYVTDPNGLLVGATGFATVAGGGTHGLNSVAVLTFAANGAASNQPFHLQVIC